MHNPEKSPNKPGRKPTVDDIITVNALLRIDGEEKVRRIELMFIGNPFARKVRINFDRAVMFRPLTKAKK